MVDNTVSEPVGDSGQRPDGEKHGLNRRKIVRASAWAIPALVVAAPTPALAASRGKNIHVE